MTAFPTSPLACVSFAVVGVWLAGTSAHAQSTMAAANAQRSFAFIGSDFRPAAKDVKSDTQAQPAPSRIGKPPIYTVAAALGAADTGFDSLNRKRQRKKPYPGAAKTPVSPGPGSPIPVVKPARPQPPSATAHKPPVAPAIAGTVVGEPPRRRLPVDTDPFGAPGVYASSFLVKSAIEVAGGYETNPGRFFTPRGSAFYVISPELRVASDWLRHSVVADLRGSFTGYGSTFPNLNAANATTGAVAISPVPFEIDRPDFTGRVDGRYDIDRELRALGQARLRVASDNPGSPNIQAGLQRYPIYVGIGGTLGIEKDFNRLTVTLNGLADRVTFQDSRLTNGVSTSNIDRNYDQYGGIARIAYDVMPGLKPFVEGSADTRKRDVEFDRFGYQRDSTGGYGKAGTTLELTRLITGEVAVGYGTRSYRDPRLQKLDGLLTSASLVYTATPLTTMKFFAASSLEETTLAGAAGTLVRTYTAQVDHDFRRWLTGIGKFTFGTLDYQGANRLDKFYSLSGDVVFRLDRHWQVKATVRHDILDSSIFGLNSKSTAGLIGVRWQN